MFLTPGSPLQVLHEQRLPLMPLAFTGWVWLYHRWQSGFAKMGWDVWGISLPQ